MYRIVLFEPDAVVSMDIKNILGDYAVSSTKNLADLKSKLVNEEYDLLILHLSNTEKEIKTIGQIKKEIEIPVIVIDPMEGKYYPFNDRMIRMPVISDELLASIDQALTPDNQDNVIEPD